MRAFRYQEAPVIRNKGMLSRHIRSSNKTKINKKKNQQEKTQRPGTRETCSETELAANSSAYHVRQDTQGEERVVRTGQQPTTSGVCCLHEKLQWYIPVRGKEREKKRQEETHLRKRQVNKCQI